MRRCLTQRAATGGATIEMAPLIDMVFLLLIFYIVSAHFAQESAVPIDRPESQSASVVPSEYLSVTIAKNGVVYAGNHVVEPNDETAIASALRAGASRRILIQADCEVPTALLLQVLDACNASGAEAVDVAAVKQ